MIGRWGLAFSVLVLAVFAVVDLGLVTGLLGQIGDLPKAVARGAGLLAGLTGPGPRLALAGRAAMEAAAEAAATATVVGTCVACAAARLSRPAGALLLGLMRLPALTMLGAWVLAGVLLIGTGGPVIAALTGFDVANRHLGPTWTLALMLTPVIAAGVAGAAGRLDRAMFEALATLGMGPVRRLLTRALPAVLPAVFRAGVFGFAGAALLLVLRAWPAAVRQEAVSRAAAGLDVTAIWALAFCLALLVAAVLAVASRE